MRTADAATPQVSKERPSRTGLDRGSAAPSVLAAPVLPRRSLNPLHDAALPRPRFPPPHRPALAHAGRESSDGGADGTGGSAAGAGEGGGAGGEEEAPSWRGLLLGERVWCQGGGSSGEGGGAGGAWVPARVLARRVLRGEEEVRVRRLDEAGGEEWLSVASARLRSAAEHTALARSDPGG